MKCSKCGNDLRIESDSVEKGKYCSSCEKHDFPECNSIEEVLRWIVQNRGVEVFQNSSVINAILSDLAPKDEKSRIKIKNAMAVGAGDYFYGVVQQGTLNDVSRKQFLSALSSNGFTIEFCNFIFDVFAYSINQSVAVQEKETSKTSANDSYKNITVNTEQNNKNVSHNTKTDTKRDKGEIVKGEKTWPGGTIYKGELLDNMCHGKGVMTWPSGDKFEGEFWKGKLKKGIYTYADGRVFEGEFDNDCCEGQGKQTWPDGTTYIGEWHKNQHHGKGEMFWPSGIVYEGDFLSNKRHGKGTMTWSDGTIYDGDWKNDKRDGIGITTLPNNQQYLQTYSQGNLINERELEITDRNKLCFCGSGMMYKNCHLKKRF